MTPTKDKCGHVLTVQPIIVLEHAPARHHRFFMMTNNHATGSNHIDESVQKVLNDKERTMKLPRNIFIQLLKFTRENNNRYVISYMEPLIQWGVFDVMKVGFLPVVHTLSDIDQSFSTTSRLLRTHDSITL